MIKYWAKICRYLTENAPELPSGSRYRSMSGTRMNIGPGTGSAIGTGSGMNPSYRYRSPGAPVVATKSNVLMITTTTGHPAEPRLAIIDFNQLTRGGLDLATGKNRAKVMRKSPECYSKLRR